MKPSYQAFTDRVRACRLCQGRYFEHEPRPAFVAEPSARVLIVGQAPGKRVHETGLPFNDVSGDNLREWMGVKREQFYDPTIFAIIPTALCYPGTVKKQGDLPPPAICAPTWHPGFLEYITPELILLVGTYAQAYYLNQKRPVSDVVARWREYLEDGLFPLPHPSPRNRRWLSERPWFGKECIPALQELIRKYLPEPQPCFEYK
ncbi:MAG: uracil-DNA glycosylase family protein [Candidatus Neomarinimicrobiota bacterium]